MTWFFDTIARHILDLQYRTLALLASLMKDRDTPRLLSMCKKAFQQQRCSSLSLIVTHHLFTSDFVRPQIS